jgi:hypothetical protein
MSRIYKPLKLAISAPEGPSGAVFDRRRRYRYLLWRSWQPALPAVSFIMLNPSAADEKTNDPTIARAISLAQGLGFGRIFVVNLFAYMTKSPALLKLATDPVSCKREAKLGRHNDDFIRFALTHSDKTVLAWGNHGLFQRRDAAVLEMVLSLVDRDNCYVFAMTKLGQPRHPLYTPRSISLQPAPRDLWI